MTSRVDFVVLCLILLSQMMGCSEGGPAHIADAQLSIDSATSADMDADGTDGPLDSEDAASTIDAGRSPDADLTSDSATLDDRGVIGDAGLARDASLMDRGIDASPQDASAPDVPCAPVDELCNQLDEDCDGVIDEGLGLGDPCVVGAVLCGLPGHLTCAPDGAVICEAEAMAMPMASPERCNGLDDDCDGQVDEGNPESGEACDTGRPGRCRDGALACQRGQLRCQSTLEARAEQCDGADDDCDGVVDNIPPQGACETGLQGVCAAGRSLCVAGQIDCVQVTAPAVERCDAIDNDCDGATDEDAQGTGQECNTGRRGQCGEGRRACREGALECISVQDAVPEVCDEVDQDCDGRIDESSQGADVPCDPGWASPNCQRQALMECQRGALICVRDADPADPCDGIDTDCDGRIGEDVLGQICEMGAVGQCDLGSTICEEGAPLCVASFESSCELPNDLDDDCDGLTDEEPERFCAPPETQINRFCMDDNNRVAGLDMAVDAHGELWVVRASITSGSVYLSHIEHDGTENREQIYGRTAIAGNFPMVDAAITLHNERPAVCFWKATTGTLFASLRGAAGDWTAEEILDRDVSGQDCDIVSVNGQIVVVYRDDEALWLARRLGAGNWRTERIDAPESSAAYDLEVHVHQGSIYIAHTDRELGQLRLTHQANGGWATVTVRTGRSIGFRPKLMVLGQRLFVIHGETPQFPDQGGDATLLLTDLRIPTLDDIETVQLVISGQGGAQAIMPYQQSALVLARSRMRDAVFGDQDGLLLRKLIAGDSVNSLEVYDIADRRHTFTRLNLSSDPFGLPVISFVDEGGSLRGEPGFGRACFYRPNDLDGDHIPDVAEIDLGTDPDHPDTDRDGRTDGQEVLHDGTDPLQP